MGIKYLLENYRWVIILGIIMIIVVVFIIGVLQMNRKIAKEIDMLMSSSENREATIIEEKDLEELPEPVQKWLKTTGVVGKERVQAMNFSQRGKMKLKPEQEKWMEPSAKQYVRVDEPGYLWHVDLPMIPLINTKGRDLFYEGKGSMEIRIGSLIPVVNEKPNDQLNESSLHRFLLELPWYPTAALEEYMTWEEIDHKSARAVLSYEGITVDAIFYFDETGHLIKQEALRYKENHAEAEKIPCIGEVKGYTSVEGMKIPNQFHVTWIIDDEPFTWYKLENYDIVIKR